MPRREPDFSDPLNILRQAVRRQGARPVSLGSRLSRWRREWPEHPHPAFFLSVLVILLGLAGTLAGGLAHLTAGVGLPRLIVSAGLSLDTFKGLSTRHTRDLLGAPTLIRHEPPAEVWQYRTAECVLDLYVYPEARKQVVSFAELRTRRHFTPTASPDCLRDLATRH